MDLNPLQFGEQLDMFKPAHEIVEGMETGDFENSHDFDNDEGWQEKLHEAKHDRFYQTYAGRESLYDSVGRSGIKQPVAIRHTQFSQDEYGAQLANGHHRVAAAYAHDPNYLVPVAHYDAMKDDRIEDWDTNDNPDRLPAATRAPGKIGTPWPKSPIALPVPPLTSKQWTAMMKSK